MRGFGVWCVGFFFFLVIDLVFISQVMGPLYANHYPNLLRQVNDKIQLNVWAALACYTLMVVGLWYFCGQLPSTCSWAKVFFQGFFLGVLFYGIFDLTNLAILSGWSWWISAWEILWGGVICSATYAVMFAMWHRWWV